MIEDLFVPIIKIGILLILFFYAIFALLIVKQVTSMTKTLVTEIGPVLRIIAFLHAGIAVGLVVLMFGLL
jgi:hypothetical protein